ncbi:MAG: tRNA (adenosine(37)-N6)-threonylcarbamoyltransferase complex transferase subunit TsaD [Limnochordia bacterium]|nr:tRNA (adenosine(37)-N6)-threonylcarbamoyltransferase complex transferase subunit TsaD [Bacillota bacterium]NLL08937.1 tRNA (adenosine(37)-N6)-threonylcarbamoyltransferase complex transferase subunit TsaD [Bacillota bacterium]HBG10421.1 tRNA (adenosine(37)-N6)-threonylcarbamoyltransferase complex transferase subunit TsaD [Bacillota bacterium]
MKSGLTLGIETSCDETAAAVIKGGREILSNVVLSQIDIHQKYGGVVPEIASRHHIEAVFPVIQEALQQAQVGLDEIEVIAVTYGPGLVGSLLVGVAAAKALAFAADKPLVGVNHIEGHIYANFLTGQEIKPPLVCLTVSGGHTDLLLIPRLGEYEILGRTRDDAAGEAFDKVARVLGLPYPGGPQIERLAQGGNKEAIAFPRGLLDGESFDFSFSGLKTAALNYLNEAKQKRQEVPLADFAASFQWAIIDVLTQKLMAAAQAYGVDQVILSGGVAANKTFREHVAAEAAARGKELLYPPVHLCTDNAAMIGSAGYFRYLAGQRSDYSLNAVANLRLGDD